ncbi:MAG: hypothetical protein EOP86_17615 [Verrucomicrobiaceae bacterium]|nr:MAG: hypothetical protein EOP86_17615 [Verrucomicrobiaceae bacterium]
MKAIPALAGLGFVALSLLSGQTPESPKDNAAQAAAPENTQAQPERFRYYFDLEDSLNCRGTSELGPERFGSWVSGLAHTGGFVQVEDYLAGSGERSTAGFINSRRIVRFHLE